MDGIDSSFEAALLQIALALEDVILAKAGIIVTLHHVLRKATDAERWIPAFAGMTALLEGEGLWHRSNRTLSSPRRRGSIFMAHHASRRP
ncbi:hypothetical protein L3D22_04225 [Lysobacter soli]|uniref:hypothetical protein n=1 Tax=Lysobacter soli TaxID=453783 RepID=UPI00209F914D|nr:hypothetical protein [Lysobacter soli]MDG2519432.1 hypothetical protein [Lysobacter soli]UTA55056.1 hypothetical protein L3D22_04225 [Lysobacter soli]